MPSATVKTTLLNNQTVKPEWFIVDADHQIVGRLAVKLATILMGKHKPTYTPHVDTGDYIIVLNVDKVRFTGSTLSHAKIPYFTSKMLRKTYERYTGYPGGRRILTGEQLWQRHPEAILREAVRRMLPKNKLGMKMLNKLKLFTGTEHPHQAQEPKELPEHLRS